MQLLGNSSELTAQCWENAGGDVCRFQCSVAELCVLPSVVAVVKCLSNLFVLKWSLGFLVVILLLLGRIAHTFGLFLPTE